MPFFPSFFFVVVVFTCPCYSNGNALRFVPFFPYREKRERRRTRNFSVLLYFAWLLVGCFFTSFFFCCCSLVSLLSPTSLMSYLLSRSQCVCVCVYIMRLRSESGATASLRLLRRRPLFFPSTGKGERGSGDARMHTQAAVNCVELAICRR